MFSVEAWLQAHRISNRVVAAQPGAWLLKTDLLGGWHAAVFTGGKEANAGVSNVAPPRTAPSS